MDVIILGVYNESDVKKLEKIISKLNSLEIIWDYESYNIESSHGIKVMERNYKLYKTGILIKKRDDSDTSFTSYPLIYEVSENYLEESLEKPKLFSFIHELILAELDKIIIAFVDEWVDKTLVRIEECKFSNLISRLNTSYVWCDTYVDLVNNTELRHEESPLILEVK